MPERIFEVQAQEDFVEKLANDGDPLDYCTFASTASGNVHSWEDAEWITAYNGTGGVECPDGTYQYPPGYYIQWDSTREEYYVNKVTNPTCGTHGSYVGDVCNQAAY